MQTSAQGIEFLERHEGVVLKSYRCPAGVWTIGAGLTAASGVVKPRAGMVIGEAEATRLLQLALRRNYEPRVAKAMPDAKQHEFDAGVSFDFNTGAIHRASWVQRWLAGNLDAARTALLAWNKGGGRVLPGLTRRREEEFALLARRDYGAKLATRPARSGLARLAVSLSLEELRAARAAFIRLGYTAIGPDPLGFDAAEVKRFQADHDLTVDGIVGRATLSTLQRMIDARDRAAVPVSVTTVGAADTGAQVTADLDPALAWLGPAALAVGVVLLAWFAWRYRDALAAIVAPKFPRLARKLWSI
jgi:lysozyme